MFDLARSVRLRGFSSLPGAAMLAVAAMMLSGCEVTEASGNNYRSGPVCPMIYDPVCAERRGETRTFPNACQARAEDWRVVASGQCRGGSDADFRRDRDARDDRNPYSRNRDRRNRDFRDNSRDRYDRRDFERPRFDNRPGRDFQPTPRNRPDRVTPPVQQVEPVRPQPPVAQPVVPDGACPQVFQQVCGQVGSSTRMFMNRCELQRAGAAEVAAGQCMGGNR